MADLSGSITRFGMGGGIGPNPDEFVAAGVNVVLLAQFYSLIPFFLALLIGA